MTHSTASDMIKHSGNTLNVQVQRPQGRSPGIKKNAKIIQLIALFVKCSLRFHSLFGSDFDSKFSIKLFNFIVFIAFICI
jgi:hypothetical protein